MAWRALIEARDQIGAALDATHEAFNRDTLNALRDAIEAYIAALPPIVGHERAFRYEATYRAFEQGWERVTRLHAALGVPPDDETNQAFWTPVVAQFREAGDAAAQAWDELQAAITAEVERDLGPQP